jgi:general secretion pathway protein G
MSRSRGERGFTYLELVATTAILMILASAIMPMAKVSRKRQKEIELRRELRILRTAIDEFQKLAGTRIGGSDVKLGSEGYPATLEILVEGVTPVADVSGRKLKFLRRIPVDPMTRTTEWGLRCYQDDPDSDSWCGSNVYDVYTKSQGVALDGTKYSDW